MLGRFLVIGFGLMGCHAFAQAGPTLVGAGYDPPGAIFVAPGQISRLEVSGLKTVLGSGLVRAGAIPLPSDLNGISVTVRQYCKRYLADPYQLSRSIKAPLVSLGQSNVCSSLTPSTADRSAECLRTYITAQMPFELETNNAGCPCCISEIVISENGVDSKSFAVRAVDDQVHVVTTCDRNPASTDCQSIVAHADGSLISAQSPAAPGEVVIVYAWGLQPGAYLKTGEVTPTPAPPTKFSGWSPMISLDFLVNSGTARVADPVSASYMTAGQVGLYQVHVQLPASFPVVQPCGEDVGSNLTINLKGMWASDSAAICVKP
jgi:uncharacterized protein (TIGR03437 family)